MKSYDMARLNFNIVCRRQQIAQISNFKFHLKSINSHDYKQQYCRKEKNRVQTLKFRKLNRCNFEAFPLNNIKFAIPATVEQSISHLHTFVTFSTALRWHSRLHNTSSFAVVMTPPRSSSFPWEMWKATILALVQQWELFATSKKKLGVFKLWTFELSLSFVAE